MGIFRQFPYSNFHEMNMDELIKLVRQLADDWLEYQQKWAQLYTDVDKAFEAFKSDFDAFIAQCDNEFQLYIRSVDVEQQFRNALNAMVDDGTFSTIIAPIAASTTTAWLNDHITQPTTPAIDSSLLTAGAAADAKAAGDWLRNLDADLIWHNEYDVLRECFSAVDTTHNGVTYNWNPSKSVTMTGTASPASFCNIYFNTGALPKGLNAGQHVNVKWSDQHSYLHFLFYNGGSMISEKYIQGYQCLKVPSNADGCVIRVYVVNGESVNNTVLPVILSHGFNFDYKYLGNINDTWYTMDAVPVNTVALCTGSEAQCPLPGYGGFLVTIGGLANIQFYICSVNGRTYHRLGITTNNVLTYGNWLDLPTNWAFLAGSICQQPGSYSGDLNDAPPNSVVINTGSATNAPATGAGYCMTMGSKDNTGTRIQIYYRWNTGAIYYRQALNMVWTGWSGQSGTGNANAKMYSIGNSILTGSVWLDDQGMDHLSAYGNAPYSVIADAVGITKANVDHTLISNTGVLYDAGDGSFLDNITSADLSDYDVVLTHFWLSDMNNYNIGSLSSTAGDGTLAGAILTILNYMESQNPNAQLILCSVPPSSTTIKGSSVFTGNYPNGSSISDLDTLMHSLAAREHFTYIDWQNLNLSYRYQSSNITYNNNNVHFNNEDSYRVLGAYAGARANAGIAF